MSWKRRLVFFSCTVLSVFADPNPDPKESVSLLERSKDFYVLSQDDFEAIIDLTRPPSLQNLTLVLNISYSVDVPGIVTLKSPPMDQKTIIDGSSFALRIHAEAPGIVIVQIGVSTYNSSIPLKIPPKGLFLRITVGRSRTLQFFSDACGWLYVVTWNLSFYPQVLDNFGRKSVRGLHFDYLAFNTLGHTCYMIYNLGLFAIPTIVDEFERRNPLSLSPVEFNDLFFPIHGVALCLVGIIQCCIYERGSQNVSWTCRIVILAMMLVITDRIYFAAMATISWLDFIYFLSSIKLLITLLKYVPQAYWNFKRKSTFGWSIGVSLFDLVGGVFSLVQMIILAWDHDDWASLYGNVAKLSLGLISILFDLLYAVQHFVLYKHKPPMDKADDAETLPILSTPPIA